MIIFLLFILLFYFMMETRQRTIINCFVVSLSVSLIVDVLIVVMLSTVIVDTVSTGERHNIESYTQNKDTFVLNCNCSSEPVIYKPIEVVNKKLTGCVSTPYCVIMRNDKIFTNPLFRFTLGTDVVKPLFGKYLVM